jgi:hypothetical protein
VEAIQLFKLAIIVLADGYRSTLPSNKDSGLLFRNGWNADRKELRTLRDCRQLQLNNFLIRQGAVDGTYAEREVVLISANPKTLAFWSPTHGGQRVLA